MISTSGLALANNAELATPENTVSMNTVKADKGVIVAGGGGPIFDNGPLVSSPGTGVGGDLCLADGLDAGANVLDVHKLDGVGVVPIHGRIVFFLTLCFTCLP